MERKTLGIGMAMLAGLHYEEAGTDIEHNHLNELNTSACAAGYSYYLNSMSSPSPISWASR